jgi:hypothetical protein
MFFIKETSCNVILPNMYTKRFINIIIFYKKK